MVTTFRRRLPLVAITVAALALGACSSSGQGNPAAGGGSSKLVVAAGGGDYQQFQAQYVVPRMSACNGGTPKITWDYTEDDAKMTKMRTEKGGTGSFDVMELPDDRMQALADAGLLEKLDPAKLSNSAQIRSGLDNPYWIPHIYSASVIIYNKDKVQPAPDSYAVLWDPKYAGKIGVLSTQWSNFYYAAAALVSNGQDNLNWDAGWSKLQELAGKVHVFGSQEEMGQALMSGEILLTVNWKARALQWSKAGDVPLGAAVPKEGTFPIVFTAAIPANAPNLDCAYDFLNAMLDADAQSNFAKNMGYAPTVNDATVAADLQKKLDFTDAEQALIKPLDLEKIVKNDPRWGQQWQQQFINK